MAVTRQSQRATAARLAPSIALLCLLVCAMLPSVGRSAEVQVTSHTVGQVFEYTRIDGEVVPHQRFTERVGVAVWDLNGDGSNTWRLQSSLRVDTNLGLRSDDRDAVPALARRFDAATLHYAFLEGRRVLGRVDLRLGRVVLADTLGWLDLDGGWVVLRVVGGLFLEALGGLEVKQDVLVLNDAAFDPDGTDVLGPGPAAFDAPVVVTGAGLGYRWGERGAARVAYRRHFRATGVDLEQERIGAEAQGELGPVSGRGDLVWNAFVDRIERADARLAIQALRSLRLGAAYARRLPVFDADSIFNVFEVRGFDEARVETTWAPSRALDVGARAGVKHFGEAPSGASESAWSGRLSAAWSPWPGVWTRVTHETDAGAAGRKHYSALFGSSPRFFDTVRVSAALVHVAFASTHRDAFEGHGFGGRLDVELHLGPLGDLRVTVDEAVNPTVDHELRVIMLLDLDGWL